MTAAPVRVLELRSVRGTGGGPEKTILHGAALSDPSRYAITVCYIRDQRDAVFSIGERAAALDVDYVEVVERNSLIRASGGRSVGWSAVGESDIIHAHDYKTNLLAWTLARAEQVIPLTTLHGYTGHSWRERIYYAADKRLVARFPRIITVSGELERHSGRRRIVGPHLVTILNGIDDRAFQRDHSLDAAARAELGLHPGQARTRISRPPGAPKKIRSADGVFRRPLDRLAQART